MGPILGPALGGWLTDNYSWRWVFYINLPIGVLAFAGLFFTMPESRNAKPSRFDFLGFTSLSLAIAALQMMLDRGQLLDWFSSREIVIEGLISVISFYVFLVHTFTYPKPFLNPHLFQDRNFVASNIFIFVVGVVLFATLALLPPMLQNLYQYPVTTTGLVTAPRGIGTMIAMMVAGRLTGKIDLRLIVLFGLVMTAFAMWQMSHFNLQMGMGPVIISGLAQGFGLGFVFVTLSAGAFATLGKTLRNDGTAIFSLMRNIGSSIGISIVEALLVENTQIAHAELIEHIRPDNPLIRALGFPLPTATAQQLALVNAEVTRQAAMISYIDDFKFVMVVTIAVMPILLLLRKPKQSVTAGVAMD
jgi:DHA2 family multidrug resistance protein